MLELFIKLLLYIYAQRVTVSTCDFSFTYIYQEFPLDLIKYVCDLPKHLLFCFGVQ